MKNYLLFLFQFTTFYRKLVISGPYMPTHQINCGRESSKCPTEWPCCSQYGFCGSGPVCIVGCNPKFSFEQESCLYLPAMLPASMKSTMKKNKNKIWRWTMNNTIDPLSATDNDIYASYILSKDKILEWTKYLITDNEKAAENQWNNIDFTYSGKIQLSPETSELYLSMPKKSAGSLVNTAKNMLYGRVSVRLKTARSRGVITTIVLFSSVQDEIDFEFLGGDLMNVQTNYYYQGNLDHTKMRKFPVSSNTYDNYHTYEIDWNEERIHWIVDNQILRTLYKRETFDPATNTYKYPQTPLKLHLSLWPGGNETNSPGTISWAGGLIDWENAPDIKLFGEFYFRVQEIIVEPYATKHTANLKNKLLNNKNRDTLNLVSYGFENNQQKFDESTVKWVRHNSVPRLRSSKADGRNPNKS
ncbi:putative glycosylase SCDLUD_000261 [Saccharomycodes ludwigii]|uniref:putative glycosylase n=1 Tax=Saccharomycodes ludwigii TaxID=36035 RepID=UPI001E854D3B|nr:hypothetical protein SCDLUD_000261 [Saccharomycodes ludwigii]KAH3902678.1 hypothetical protein SCDLUD_000261 [Saccharomycodes ludwigii]